LPKVPPDTARDEQKQIVLTTTTIARLLNKGAPGSFVEKYDILWNHFTIGSSLIKTVKPHTMRFRDLLSPAYVYSDVQVLWVNINHIDVADPVTNANRAAARFVLLSYSYRSNTNSSTKHNSDDAGTDYRNACTSMTSYFSRWEYTQEY
jgi:hypothetical protein